MSDETPVTRYELDLVLRPIREDIGEVKEGQKELRAEMNEGFEKIADSQWLGPQGRSLLTGAGILSALVSLGVAILILIYG